MKPKLVRARSDDIVLSAIKVMRTNNSYFVQVIDIVEECNSAYLTVYNYFPNYYSILVGVANHVNEQFYAFLNSHTKLEMNTRKNYNWFFICLMEYLHLDPFLTKFLGEDLNSLVYINVDTRVKTLYLESKAKLVNFIYLQLEAAIESGEFKLPPRTTLSYISERLYQNYQQLIARLSGLSDEARKLELSRFKYFEFGLLDNLGWLPASKEYDYEKLQGRMFDYLQPIDSPQFNIPAKPSLKHPH